MTNGIRIGWTLIEALVAIAIVGILLSLTVIGISAARESSRRVACSNNLRQLGIAVHSFESRSGVLPSRRLEPYSVPGTTGTRLLSFSTHFNLLDDLELSNVKQLAYRAAKFWEHGVVDPWGQPIHEDHPAVATPIAVFQCPSDPIVGRGTNYRFCTGPDVYSAFMSEIEEGGKGPFRLYAVRKLSDLQRGTSNTVFASERLRSRPESVSSLSAVWCAPLEPPMFATTELFVRAAEQALQYPPSSYFDYNGLNWFGDGYDSTLYNHVLTPNSRYMSLFSGKNGPNHGAGGAIMTATSNHRGGVFTLNGDGAVVFTSERIDLSTWQEISLCQSSPK